MPVQTRSRTRADAATTTAIAESLMHFASRAEADAYILRTQMQEVQKGRPTRRKRTALARLLACHDALKSPVYKLPDEILSMIFKYACDGTCAYVSMSCALTLSHVTRRWRSVMLTIPQLWTHIPVNPQIRTQALLSRIQAFTDRSRSLPIQATVDVASLIEDRDETELKLIADAVCRKVYPRCDELIIEGDFVWDTNAQILAPGLFTFQLTPHLRVLSLVGIEFSPNRSTCLLRSLQSCVALEDLTFANCDCWPESDFHNSPPGALKTAGEIRVYTLPSVRTLKTFGDRPVKVLSSLRLPKVEEWTLGDWEWYQAETGMDDLMQEMEEPLRNRMPVLRKLTLEAAMVNVHLLCQFFIDVLPLETIDCKMVYFKGQCVASSEALATTRYLLPPAAISSLKFSDCRGVERFLDTFFSHTKPHSAPCRIFAKPKLMLTAAQVVKFKPYAVSSDGSPLVPIKPPPIVVVL